MQFNYSKKYVDYLRNPAKMLSLSDSTRNNVLKALVCLSKYLGTYLEFKEKLKQFGIKWSRSDSFDSFIRIMTSNHGDLLEWFSKAYNVVSEREKLYLELMLISGMRMSEGMQSFNLIIDLHKKGSLDQYFNRDLSILEHYKHKQFLRGCKNVYISIVPENLIAEIARCSPVSYTTLRKHLINNGLKTRIKELRQYWGSFMVRHGLIREEVDLLQGRVPKSIFIRHYWSPSLKDLKNRTLKALEQLKQTIEIIQYKKQ